MLSATVSATGLGRDVPMPNLVGTPRHGGRVQPMAVALERVSIDHRIDVTAAAREGDRTVVSAATEFGEQLGIGQHRRARRIVPTNRAWGACAARQSRR